VKKRHDKEKEVAALQEQLAQVSTVILTTFQGIKAGEDTRLRRAVESAGGHYRVLKNTLAERAAKGTPAEPLLKGLQGTNSIAYTNTDPVVLAKVLSKVAKEVPAFRFKAGLVEGRVVSLDELQRLAELPSRNELMAKLVFLLQAPARGLAATLNAVPRNLAAVLNEAVQAKKLSE
jgi:large subunit ribosomal protein L10